MLFNKKIEPSCSYCFFGSRISDEEVACIKKGVVSSGTFCRKFKYDPLKRAPSKPTVLNTSDLTQDDFSL